PFGALYTPDKSGPLTPLMVEHEIVSLPSASVLAVLRRELAGREPASKLVAVLADPVLQTNDQRVKKGQGAIESNSLANDLDRSANEAGLISFERLPFTREEAEAIVAQSGRRQSLKALDFDAS